MAAKKKSGTNVEDWQRGTERLTLRLKPKVMRLLYSLSTEIADSTPGTIVSYAATIKQALHALNREMNAECEANGAAEDAPKWACRLCGDLYDGPRDPCGGGHEHVWWPVPAQSNPKGEP